MARVIFLGSRKATVLNTAIASLTDNSGGTASSTLAAIEGTYTEATVENTVASLAAKINAILVALRAAKIISS